MNSVSFTNIKESLTHAAFQILIGLFYLLSQQAVGESFTWKPGQDHMSTLDLNDFPLDPIYELHVPLTDYFVPISGGKFRMGDLFGDGTDHERPVHEVLIKDFDIGKHEITQSQWQSVMNSNPSINTGCDDCPVENVSWLMSKVLSTG